MSDKQEIMVKGDAQIVFSAVGVNVPALPENIVRPWIEAVAERHGFKTGALTYVFCDDDEILRVNRAFLNHDYYTDIITFDYTNNGRICGDMFISLDTVRSNAEQRRGDNYNAELLRVIIHGVLHLCGINDKGPGERQVMQEHEDEALQLFVQIARTRMCDMHRKKCHDNAEQRLHRHPLR